jgi:hypothetical protein
MKTRCVDPQTPFSPDAAHLAQKHSGCKHDPHKARLLRTVRREVTANCHRPTQVMIALVLVASRVHLVDSSVRGFASEAARSSFETAFEVTCVQKVFDANITATVIKVQTDIDPTGDVDTCRKALGALWTHVSDEEEPPAERGRGDTERSAAEHSIAKAAATAQRLAWLWTAAPDASLHLFQLDFGSSVRAARRYPLIAALLKHERRLTLIGCVADVLRWHAVLFSALRNGLRRDEAAEMSNAQAIERLPHDQQAEAQRVLSDFCTAFVRPQRLELRVLNASPRSHLPRSLLVRCCELVRR